MIPRWAVSVPIRPGEAFSGWLVRAALTLGCDPLVLTGSLWPGWRIWTMDCDRGMLDARLAVLASASGIPPGRLRAAMLPAVMESVAGRVPALGEPWPWVRPFGRKNRRCVQGWQYCPACLAADDPPYMRLNWRLAWHVGCERHGTLLVDRCPHCGGPVLPHRLLAEDGSLARCALCGGDLRRAESTNAVNSVVDVQRRCDRAAATGRALRGAEYVPASAWFDLIRFMTGWLRRLDLKRRRALVRRLLPDAGEIERPALALGIEALSVEDRARLLGPAARLASLGVAEMTEAALTVGLTDRSFHDRGRLPVLLEPVVASLPQGGRKRRKGVAAGGGPRPRAVVERMWRRLQRKAGLA